MALLEESQIQQARDADIVELVGRYVQLSKAGTEYRGLCPFHKEKSPSFSVVPDKQMYYCFGCGAGGGPIDFVCDFEDVSFRDAVQSITGKSVGSEAVPAQRQSRRVEESPKWTPITPIPANLQQQPMDIMNRKIGGKWEKLEAAFRWEYFDLDGQLLGYVYRFNLPTGGKEVTPQTYCVNNETGEMAWRWLSFGKPRPMYGLHKLALYPDAQVMMVEGEKAADAAQDKFIAAGVPIDKLITLAWPGGGKAVPFVDWSPLKDRSVGLWPDADRQSYPDRHALAGQIVPFLEQPGTSAMLSIFDIIASDAAVVKFIVPPIGVADGWDLADEPPTGFHLLPFIRTAAILAEEVRTRFAVVAEVEPEEPVMPWVDIPTEAYAESGGGSPAPSQELPAVQPQPRAPKSDDGDDDDDLIKNVHFTILGYDHEDYYLFNHAKRQVMRIGASDMNEIKLAQHAPVNWWEFHFPAGKKGGIDKLMAAQWIFAQAHARGIYDPTRIRGRGVWIDKDRFVFHHGSYLTVDGVATDIAHIASSFVYPMARQMPEPSDKPLTDTEGQHLAWVADQVRWSMMGSGALMAGWVMLASICGALGWRSHIWLTGGAGSGKTTIQRDFCQALLNGISVYAQGNSTEAGIRQKLKADALPVLIDEAESNNDKERLRVESILSLIRQASSESQAETYKGTVSGDTMSFHIRSMFCLASINTNLDKQADIDRLTKLSIRSPSKEGADAEKDAAHWEMLKEELHKIKTDPSLPSRLLARAINMLPVILQNIDVFARVAAKHFGTQRDGDQFGTMLAGCWCLQKSHVASEQEAMVLIKGYDWTEHTEDHDQDDSQRALESILNAKIKLGGGAGDLTIFELVREAHTHHNTNLYDGKAADAALRRHGVRVMEKEGVLLFGTSVPNLKQLLVNSAFCTDVRGQLLRLVGATKFDDKSVKFNGSGSKCVAVPLDLVLDVGTIENQNELPI